MKEAPFCRTVSIGQESIGRLTIALLQILVWKKEEEKKQKLETKP